MSGEKVDIEFKFEQWGIACYSGDANIMQRIHSHCEIELNWVTSGYVKYQFSDTEIEFHSGKLYIFNGIRPHQLIYASPRAKLNWITIPSEHIFNWTLSEDFVNHLANCDLLVDDNSKEFTRDQFRFERWSEDIAENNIKSLDILLLEIRCRLKRLLIKDDSYRVIKEHTNKKMSIVPPKKASNLVSRMQGYILKNLFRKISMEELARAVGLNPNYATTIFRKEVGQTPTGFILAKRIDYVQFLLITTNKPILDIALDAGFGSLSRFYDAFNRSVGIPPLEYRKKQAKSSFAEDEQSN